MAVRWALHVDLDQFIAAVEVLRRPELQGRAVVVGGRGDPMERSVVSTASYEARRFGVGSRMPLRIAARKCPDAVFLPVDAPAYQAVSAQVMETLRSGPAVVEVLGWDEAFLGVDTDDPELFAREVQQDLTGWTQVHAQVRRLARQVAHDVRGEGRPAVRVTVKVRYAPFETHTRSMRLETATDDTASSRRLPRSLWRASTPTAR